jgi:heptaprenyl diphosphate synthase
MINKKDTPAFEISFFAALCLFLSAVEYAIPKPIPFLRLGLANLPIILAIKKFNHRDIFILVVLKILGQAFISGTLFSYIFLFSASGSFVSGFVMTLMYDLFGTKGKHGRVLISNIGISLAGALGNNCAQLLCAKLILFGDNTKYIAPVLLISGMVTGLIFGIFASLFEIRSNWFNQVLVGTDKDIEKQAINKGTDLQSGKPVEKVENLWKNSVWFVCSLVTMCIFVFVKQVLVVWILVFIFYICTLIKRHGKVKIMPSVFITISVTFFAILSPYGKVLFSIGSWRITQDALLSGLHRSGILVGMVFLSQCAVSKELMIPGKVGKFVASMFRIFESLTAKRISFKPNKIISSIDERLIEIWNEEKVQVQNE